METIDYIKACKEKLGIESNYALAKETGIPESRLSEYMRGKRAPDEFACFKFAEILGLSPAQVIAEVQARSAKSETKRLYFQRFFSTAGLWIILGVGLAAYSPIYGAEQGTGNDTKPRVDTGIQDDHKRTLCEINN